MLKTDVKRALYLAEAGAELCGTILSGVIPSLILFAQALLLLSLVALALIGLRILLIDIAPTLARSSKTVAAAINIFMDVFAILIEYIKLAIYGIEVMIEILSLGAYHPKSFKQTLRFPKPISASQIVTFSNTAAHTCPSINSIGAIFDFLAPQIFHNTFCPILRATKPITVVGPVLQTFLGWGVEGGYETYPSANCRELEDFHPKSTCVFLAAGIILAELFIPLLLFGIVIKSSGTAIKHLLAAVAENVLTACEIAYGIIGKAVRVLNLAPLEEHISLGDTVHEPLLDEHHSQTIF